MSIIRRTIAGWLSWRSDIRLKRQTRKTLRANPELAELARKRQKARQQHKAIAPIEKKMQRSMTGLLGGKVFDANPR